MVTVDWANYTINVAKTDMVQTQTTPVEVYELNINDFRLALKALEASEEGMAWPDTHEHTPPFTVSGTTLARVVEILLPYTITFEDAQYNVNIVGGNSNISDRTNKNQVGVNTANSAGLQDPFALQAAAFADQVILDSLLTDTGTTFPFGTRQKPVNNAADALTIAQERGLRIITLVHDYTLASGDFSDDFVFQGDNQFVKITVEAAADVTNATFRSISVGGVVDSANSFQECVVEEVTIGDCIMRNCHIVGPINMQNTITSSLQALLMQSCVSAVGGSDPTDRVLFDVGGVLPMQLIIRDFRGSIEISNMTGQNFDMSMDMGSGRVIVASTVTGGTIPVRGIAEVIDNSTGTAQVIDRTVQVEIERSAYDGKVYLDSTNGIAGTSYPVGTRISPVSTLAQAKAIADARGLRCISVIGTYTATAGEDISGYTIAGDNPLSDIFSMQDGVITEEVVFRNVCIDGYANGAFTAFDCAINGMNKLGANTIITYFKDCFFLSNQLSLRSGLTTPKAVQFDDCVGGIENVGLQLDLNGSSEKVAFHNYKGRLTITNMISASEVFEFGGTESLLTIDSSCTAGEIILRGVLKTINNSTSSNLTISKLDAIDTEKVSLSGEPYGQGTVTSNLTATTTTCSTNLTQAAPNHWQRSFIRFTTGDLSGQIALVSTYTPTNGQLVFEALTSAPSTGDKFVLVNA